MDFWRIVASMPHKHDTSSMTQLKTIWGEQLDPHNVLPEHPRPQFKREAWQSLNGWWQCAIVACGSEREARDAWRDAPEPAQFSHDILVPFSPEASLSGVGHQLLPSELLWYRTTFEKPSLHDGERLLLHFDAVDHSCACRVNSAFVGEHRGGYLPFCLDITDALVEGQNIITLCVHDPSDYGGTVHGKQRVEHIGIWYTPQSGIWQPVWLEVVPTHHIERIDTSVDIDTGALAIRAQLSGVGGTLCVAVRDAQGAVVAQAQELVVEPEVGLHLQVPSPRLWSPDDPYLYGLELDLDADHVESYVAFRSACVAPDDQGRMRFCLNGQPLFLYGVLDQGYWPDGLMTAPSDEALAFDIQTARSLGFNMMRMHVKIERDRWYYLCDKLGMLVWQDMVSGGVPPYDSWMLTVRPTFIRQTWSAYRDDTPLHRNALMARTKNYRLEWMDSCVAAVEHLRNHPSIVTWVLFNEGWGQFDARAATQMVHHLDPTRPIDSTSGWYDQRCGDYHSVHNYFRPLVLYRDHAKHRRAFVISEFGGFSWHDVGHSSYDTHYGYGRFETIQEWYQGVIDQLARVLAIEDDGLAGFVYTQLFDIEEETNGLLTYDRKVNKLFQAALQMPADADGLDAGDPAEAE